MRAWLRAAGGAAAFVLSIAAVAPAQQVQPDTARLTEAHTAGVRRLKEMIGVLNTGDYATIRAYCRRCNTMVVTAELRSTAVPAEVFERQCPPLTP